MEKNFAVVINDISVRLLEVYRDCCISSYQKEYNRTHSSFYFDEVGRYRSMSLDDLVNDYIINSFNLHF